METTQVPLTEFKKMKNIDTSLMQATYPLVGGSAEKSHRSFPARFHSDAKSSEAE